MHQTAEQTAIVVERLLPHPPEKIWRVLTESALVAEWLMPNDLRAEKGSRFQFRSQPMPYWNGLVDCEVQECDPPRRLRYSWVTEGKGALNTVVTWTLAPAEGGTLLRMEHDGFGPGNAFAYKGASSGWVYMIDRLEGVARRLD